jgi:nucleoside-diphosphate-sugar epimerase
MREGPRVKVAVTGATGVIGRAAVAELVGAGHDVVGLARSEEKVRLLDSLGATARIGRLGDHDFLVDLFAGADAIVNLATNVPVGFSGALPGAWRTNDRLRTEGVRRIVQAARVAGVRRIVQESVSFLYADQGDDWVTERSPLDITRATEPASVAEAQVQDYVCDSRVGVVLRFGFIVGDDQMTSWQLKAAHQGRSIGSGHPDGWLHPVHTDDLGSAVTAALSAPSGVYNVGAAPVRRADYVQALADAVGRPGLSFMSPLMKRLAGGRAEPLARSLRVSSDHFTASTGWAPSRPHMDASWLRHLAAAQALR